MNRVNAGMNHVAFKSPSDLSNMILEQHRVIWKVEAAVRVQPGVSVLGSEVGDNLYVVASRSLRKLTREARSFEST